MPSAVFEPATPTPKQLHTYVLVRKAKVIGELFPYSLIKKSIRENAIHSTRACVLNLPRVRHLLSIHIIRLSANSIQEQY